MASHFAALIRRDTRNWRQLKLSILINSSIRISRDSAVTIQDQLKTQFETTLLSPSSSARSIPPLCMRDML